MSDKKELKPDFGDLVLIEQHRFGADNEMYVHKVIGTLESNTYVAVPVKACAEETRHSEVVHVVACVCGGVSEREILRYRIEDVKLTPRPSLIKDGAVAAFIESCKHLKSIPSRFLTYTEQCTALSTLEALQREKEGMEMKLKIKSKTAFEMTSLVLNMCTDFEQACSISKRMVVSDLRPFVLAALKLARQHGLCKEISRLKQLQALLQDKAKGDAE